LLMILLRPLFIRASAARWHNAYFSSSLCCGCTQAFLLTLTHTRVWQSTRGQIDVENLPKFAPSKAP
jgi:hypothetical protein